MDEGRLGLVRRRENSQRKFVCILNDVVKSRWEIVDEGLNREKYETAIRHQKSVVSMRQTVVKQRVLKECMRIRRDGLQHTERWLGNYGGKRIDSFSRDIDMYLNEMHPRRRRLKKLQKLKSESVEKGKILSPSSVEIKMKNYFQKIESEKQTKKEIHSKQANQDEGERVDIFKRSKQILPPLRGFINPFYRFTEEQVNENKSQNIDDVNIDTSGQKRIRKNSEKPEVGQTNEPNKLLQVTESNDLKLERKPSLILPPIQTTKSMVLNKFS